MVVLKRFLAVALAVVVFISSGGVVLAVHICSKNSNKEVSLFSNKTCCSKLTPCATGEVPKTIKKNCCNLKITYHKVDISSIHSELSNFLVQAITIVPINFENEFVQEVFLKSVLTNKAPPFFIGGKTFLSISQNYLI